MILSAVLAAAVSAAQPAAAASPTPTAIPSLSEAAQALEAGRLEQARLMVTRAMSAGIKGPELDRLLADLAFASGKDSEALARYDQLIQNGADKSGVAEKAGIAALKLGLVDRALALITIATESKNASWRSWNARGVIADLNADWQTADASYDRALALAPDRAEVINNRGWSHLLRGDWQGAVADLERAAAADPKSARAANNLELARAALANDLPERRRGETGQAWAQRLNDAGLVAQLMGNQTKAIAAFTQALEASGTWYARAANNLEAVTARR